MVAGLRVIPAGAERRAAGRWGAILSGVVTLQLDRLRSRSPAWRAGVVTAACVAVVATVLALPPIHLVALDRGAFADRRTLLGIPNALDVLSNAVFAWAGLIGFLRLRSLEPALRPIGVVLQVALLGVTVGSGFYHLAPSPERLLFDRLPITVAFMAVLALALGDRVSPRLGRGTLAPLVAFGAGTALLWYFGWNGGDAPGAGDLRPYALTQAVPMAALPILLLLFPGRLEERRLLLALLLYGVAKGFEAFDHQIFALGGIVSGHTLKHLVAGLACFFLVPRNPPAGSAAQGTNLRASG